MKYKYYSRESKEKETLGVIEAPSREIAIEVAAQLKDLPISTFVELFNVKEMS